MQQIQHGCRSWKLLLKTLPASCLLSQTGLCCHGNMLWRSTYWDSAGWQAAVLAVWVLVHSNILTSLRTCDTLQSTKPLWFAFVNPQLCCCCVSLWLCVFQNCLVTQSGVPPFFSNNFHCICCLQKQLFFLLGFTLPQYFPQLIPIVVVSCHCMLSRNTQFVSGAYVFVIHNFS